MVYTTNAQVVRIESATRSQATVPQVHVQHQRHHVPHVAFAIPKGVRPVKDLVWLAVSAIALAVLALVVGTVDLFVAADLIPLVLGAGIASVTLGLLGIGERFSR